MEWVPSISVVTTDKVLVVLDEGFDDAGVTFARRQVQRSPAEVRHVTGLCVDVRLVLQQTFDAIRVASQSRGV